MKRFSGSYSEKLPKERCEFETCHLLGNQGLLFCLMSTSLLISQPSHWSHMNEICETGGEGKVRPLSRFLPVSLRVFCVPSQRRQPEGSGRVPV